MFPVFNYMVNTELYEAMCINKDNPEMECHGKCHLSDEMKESESEKKSTPLLEINLKDYPIGNVHFVVLDELIPSEVKHQVIPTKEYSFHIEKFIFHPPKQLV